MIVTADPKYITEEEAKALKVGDVWKVDSGLGGSWDVEIVEITETVIKVQPVRSWFWEGCELPIWTYPMSEIVDRLFTLVPAYPFQNWK